MAQKKIRVFLDSSVIVAAVLSETGSSRAIMEFAAEEIIEALFTPLVVKEARDTLKRKYTQKELVVLYNLTSVLMTNAFSDPSKREVDKYRLVISDTDDRHILSGCEKCHCEYLLTLDRKHFFTSRLAKSDLPFKIMLPGDFLSELRETL